MSNHKNNNPIIKTPNGEGSWIQKEGDTYKATGIDRGGKRFAIRSSTWAYINGINVWQGSKWLIRDGKKFLIQKVTN